MGSSERWRHPVNGLIYSVQFADGLTNELAGFHAQRLLAAPFETFTQREQYDALTRALAVEDDLSRSVPAQPHSDAQLRTFLYKVVAAMDRLRPWTEPPLRALPPERWHDFTGAAPIAALTTSVRKAQERLHHGFRPAPGDGRLVCLLALASGPEIAIVDDWWPTSGDMAVLAHTDKPQDVLDYLLAHSRLATDELTRLDSAEDK